MKRPSPRPRGRHRQSPSDRSDATHRRPAVAMSQFLRIVVGQLVAYLLHDRLE